MNDTYLMICENQIIDILYNQNKKPNWPPNIDGKIIESVLYTENNIDEIEIGMMYEDGKIFKNSITFNNNLNQEMPIPTEWELIEADAIKSGAEACILELINLNIL